MPESAKLRKAAKNRKMLLPEGSAIDKFLATLGSILATVLAVGSTYFWP